MARTFSRILHVPSKTERTMGRISDAPVQSPASDALGRWSLATTIVDLICAAPRGSAVVIGVYGRWGEGKTSVLRFIESQAQEAEVLSCQLSVWSAQTQGDLWSSLVQALQTLPWPPSRVTRIKQLWARALFWTQPLSEANSTTKAAYALARLVTRRAEISSEDAKRALKRLQGDRRVLILVDDLDRVEPVLIPKLLMGLHELFGNLEQCAVVVALDPDVVGGALAQANPAWAGIGFLEKIVQYPFWLPPPDEKQIGRLIRECLATAHVSIPESSILDLWTLLPRNPRRLKQFLRSLHRLQPTLSRLGDGEWNPSVLLLIELLRAASAEVAESLLNERRFLEGLVSGTAFMRPEDRDEETQMPKALVALISEQVKRTLALATSSRQEAVIRDVKALARAFGHLGGTTADEVYRHAQMDRVPPALTLLEFDALLAVWQEHSSVSAVDRWLSKHSTRVRRSRSDVDSACFSAAIKRANECVHSVADTLDAASERDLLYRLTSIHEVLKALTSEFDVLSVRNLERVGAFLAVRNHVSLMSNTLDAKTYTSLRESQQEFLFSLVPALRDHAGDVLKDLKPDEPWVLGPHVVGSAESGEIRDRLIESFGDYACTELLDRFGAPEGLAALNFASHPIEIWLLFDADSPFHSAGHRAQLAALAEAADGWTAQNCLTYLRMLAGHPRSRVANSTLLKDDSLIVPLWNAVCRLQPSVRLESLITELATQLRDITGDSDRFTLPSWIARGTERRGEAETSGF